MSDVTKGAYRHRIPDGEEKLHALDGEWCACAPRVQQLPLIAAEREGYLKVIWHREDVLRRSERPA